MPKTPSSLLLIGKNGAGKTTVGLALEILQRIARGENRVGNLVRLTDLARGRADVPMRIEIQVKLGAHGFWMNRSGIAWENRTSVWLKPLAIKIRRTG